jgi:hypothetical protein
MSTPSSPRAITSSTSSTASSPPSSRLRRSRPRPRRPARLPDPSRPAMTVRSKTCMLKVLPAAACHPFQNPTIPSDAQRSKCPPAPKPRPPAAKARPKAKPIPQGKSQGRPKAKRRQGKGKGPKPPAPPPSVPPSARTKPRPSPHQAPADFQVELLYSVPGGEQGSWVALCPMTKAASTPAINTAASTASPAPPPANALDPKTSKRSPPTSAGQRHALRLRRPLCRRERLRTKIPSGLYRITDSDGDDASTKSSCSASSTPAATTVSTKCCPPRRRGLLPHHRQQRRDRRRPRRGTPRSPVPAIWGDDHLLPRMPDGRGHNRHVLAPGGIIYRVIPTGRPSRSSPPASATSTTAGSTTTASSSPTTPTWSTTSTPPGTAPPASITSSAAANSAGATAPANTPSSTRQPARHPEHRPRLTHRLHLRLRREISRQVPGGLLRARLELGQNLRRPPERPRAAATPPPRRNSSPAVPCPSPTPSSASDGAMYFAIGGRRVQSGLYRVTYTGGERHRPGQPDAVPPTREAAPLSWRPSMAKQDPAAVAAAWPHLSQRRPLHPLGRPHRARAPAPRSMARKGPDRDRSRAANSRPCSPSPAGGICPTHRPRQTARRSRPVDHRRPRERHPTAGAQARLRQALTTGQRLAHSVRIVQITLHRFGPRTATTQKAHRPARPRLSPPPPLS